MGILILLITVFSLIYLFHRLGLLSLLALFVLIILCIELAIVIILMLCPETIKNYLFFTGEFNTLFANIPNEIMDPVKVKAMSSVDNMSMGELLNNLTQKFLPNEHISKQTEILSDIHNEMQKGNLLKEIQLEQFQKGKSLDLKWYSTLNNTLNSSTKSLVYAVNHPTDVVTQLNGIYNVNKPNFALLQEAQLSNSLATQSNKILLEGFNKMISVDGTQNMAQQFMDFGQRIESNIQAYQAQSVELLNKTEETLNTAMDTFQQNQAKLELNALERVEQAQAEAEESMRIASEAIENYQNSETYKKMQETSSYSRGINLPDNKTMETMTYSAYIWGIGRTAFRLIFKF